MEKNKPNTTKLDNKKTKRSKLTQKQKLQTKPFQKHKNQSKPNHTNLRTFHSVVGCTIVLHNTPRNSSDYLPSYLQTIITDRSDAVYCLNPITLNPKPSRGGQVSGGKCPEKGRSLGSLTWWRTGSPSHWVCYGVRRLGGTAVKGQIGS